MRTIHERGVYWLNNVLHDFQFSFWRMQHIDHVWVDKSSPSDVSRSFYSSHFFFYRGFFNNFLCVFDICSVSIISWVSLDRCMHGTFFLRRKQQLLSLLTAFGHPRQNKLYAFWIFFPFSYWIFIYVTAVCPQINLE
jgi:hypothetical protein